MALVRNTASEHVLETTLGMFFQQLARTSEQHGQDVHCSVGVCRIAAGHTAAATAATTVTAHDEGNGEDIRGEVDFDECVKQADLALYETKRSNKGKFTVYNYPPPSQNPQISAPRSGLKV